MLYFVKHDNLWCYSEIMKCGAYRKESDFLKKATRNGLVEALRFFATICIAVYHYEWIYIGTPIYFQHFYIWVEFFFVLSGFFLAANACRKTSGIDEEFATLHYVKREFCKLYPMYLLAFFVAFFSNYVIGNIKPSLSEILLSLWNVKWEMLLCNLFGFGSSGTIIQAGGATDYIPSLLFGSLILHYLLRNKKTFYVSVAAPVFIFIGYGRMIAQFGNLSAWRAYDGWLIAGFERALAGMSIGAMGYLILPQWLQNRRGRKIVSVVFSLFAIYALSKYANYIGFADLVIYPFVFALLVGSVYVIPIGLDSKINCFLNFLGKLSYPIFLFHFIIVTLLRAYFPGRTYHEVLPLFVLLCMVVACTLVGLQTLCRKLYMIVCKKSNL